MGSAKVNLQDAVRTAEKTTQFHWKGGYLHLMKVFPDIIFLQSCKANQGEQNSAIRE